ncbi:cell wall-binding repeat-containing protein [Peptostreptococcaceae bacterium OttesenSCG-928-C18]|nr:cell wall-binding repeat-containing protein [Peptostreptococcaceae bacterium OttesenSCG-928-C18]
MNKNKILSFVLLFIMTFNLSTFVVSASEITSTEPPEVTETENSSETFTTDVTEAKVEEEQEIEQTEVIDDVTIPVLEEEVTETLEEPIEELPEEEVLYGEGVDNSIDANSGVQNFLNGSASIKRISGSNRILTSVQVSQFTNNTADKVILASSKNYADALSASSITFGEYPVLLVDNSLSTAVINEIVRLQAKEVIILGGTGSVSQNVENSANTIATVEKVTRIAGYDRYQTSVKIAEKSINTNAVISSGQNFPDALSGTILTKNNADLILTYNARIDDSTKGYLENFSGESIKVLGGSSSITNKNYNSIKSLSGVSTLQRISGANRYDTSVNISKSIKSNTLIIASGEDFPDALSASTLSQKINAPILLVTKNIINSSIVSYIKGGNFSKAIILGGSGKISDNTMNNIQRLMNKQEPLFNYIPSTYSGHVVANGAQKVYSSASYSSTSTGTMRDRRIMKVLDQTDYWVRVNYDKTTGWIEKKNLFHYNVKSYGQVVTNVPYISQLYPVYAPRGCEPTSLLMGLKGKGYASNVNLRSFLDNMPKHSSNPAKGYVSTPYATRAQYFQTIDPEPLAKYGQRYGNVVNIQNSSIDDIIIELQNGNPVVVYVTLYWRSPTFAYKNIEGKSTRRINNNHVLLLTGYDPKVSKFYIADPYNHEKAGASRTRAFYYWKDKSTVDRLYRADNRKFAVSIR